MKQSFIMEKAKSLMLQQVWLNSCLFFVVQIILLIRNISVLFKDMYIAMKQKHLHIMVIMGNSRQDG